MGCASGRRSHEAADRLRVVGRREKGRGRAVVGVSMMEGERGW